MLPVCLPSITERYKKKKNMIVFMVDYISSKIFFIFFICADVPLDFDIERMGKKSLKLYTHKECRRHRLKSKLSSEGVTHVLCTSGCGVRSGAPIVSQNAEGAFELIGVAAGGGLCVSKSMRKRLIREPPLYIDIYPYITWVMNVVTANELPLPYPQNFMLMEGGTSIGIRKEFLRGRKEQKVGWRGRTYAIGNRCFKSIKKQRTGAFFYSEKFEVKVNPPAKLTIFMKLSAGVECSIVCARLLLPNRLIQPKIIGVGGFNISIHFSTDWFPYTFYYSLGLTGKNSTRENRWREKYNISNDFDGNFG